MRQARKHLQMDEFDRRFDDLKLGYKKGNLKSNIVYLDFMIDYTRRQSRAMGQMVRLDLRSYFHDRVWCNKMCEDIYNQRMTKRRLEEQRSCLMVSMAIQEICLNKSYKDFGAQDDVLRMIMEFATA